MDIICKPQRCAIIQLTFGFYSKTHHVLTTKTIAFGFVVDCFSIMHITVTPWCDVHNRETIYYVHVYKVFVFLLVVRFPSYIAHFIISVEHFARSK